VDYVYICRKGDNEELRYSIRSLEKNLPDVNVWVVGYKPKWYVGNFIPVKDISTKFNNIHNALEKIANHPDIADEFVLMNDDFFILKPMDEVPVIHGGLLLNKINEYERLAPSSAYTKLLIKAYKFLVRSGINNPLDYDLHVPLPIKKQDLSRTIKHKYMPRSLYGNLTHIAGTQEVDVKVYGGNSRLRERSSSIQSDSIFISTEDDSFENKYSEVIQNLFPTPSKYEMYN
jgi:hypothetical protein